MRLFGNGSWSKRLNWASIKDGITNIIIGRLSMKS